MTTLKLSRHKRIEFHLTELVKVFNGIKLNSTAAQYVTGLPVTDVDTATVLRQYNYDRASTLPNFQDYQNMGIDLSVTMPFCSATQSCLNALTATVEEYFGTQYNNELQFISYDKKVKSFVVNDAGKTALDSAVITLAGKEEELYNSVLALHALMSSVNPSLNWHLLSSDIVHPLTKELNLDSVAHFVQSESREAKVRNK